MKTTIFLKFIVITSVSILLSCEQSSQHQGQLQKNISLSQEEMIQRGKYLTTVSGCNDCHSPKVFTANGMELDTTRLLSGHPMNDPLAPIPSDQQWLHFSPGLTAFVGPWGISYAANLTPDDTGIGNWKLEQFKTAIRKGKYKGLENGRPLLPPMPWQMYRTMTDEDIEAVFAYLKSLPPVNNLVPAPVSPDKISMNK